jgi:clan AA aspartic protease
VWLLARIIAHSSHSNNIFTESMGLIFVDIELVNSDDMAFVRRQQMIAGDVRRLTVNALVDTGAYKLTISERVRRELGLFTIEKEVATLADGSKIEVDIAGPVEVRFQNRRTTVDAIVIPGDEQTLLGAIPLEGMDVVIDPKAGTMVVNPANPNIAGTILK